MANKYGWLWSVDMGTVLGPTSYMGRTRSSQAAPAEKAAPAPAEPAAPQAAETGEAALKGNVKSKSFHKPGCRYYDSPDCTTEFASREEAEKAGYQPCKVCKP